MPSDIHASALGPPPGLLVEITSRCNLTCRMCPLTTERTPSSANPGPVSDALWQQIVPFAQASGRVNIGGYGEPLLNPKCMDYLRELDGLGVHTSLTTNGTLVTARIAEQLAALPHLDSVNVSIDSPDAAIYRDIRGGIVQKALDGVGNLLAALDPSKVTVSSVMMRSNIESLMAFPAILAGLKVRQYVVQGLVDYTPGLEEEELRWRTGLPGHIERLKQACAQAGVELIFELPDRVAAEFHDPAEAVASAAAGAAEPTGTDSKQCFAPWDVPIIDKDGKMFPCCFALSQADGVMGDVTQSSPEEVWQGPVFQAFRRDIQDGRTMPAVCRSCTVVPTGPHPLRLYDAVVLEDQSVRRDSTTMRVVVQNKGAGTWTAADRVLIGTAAPRDHASAFHHATWIGANRITSFSEAAVPPGGTATFEFACTFSDLTPEDTFQLVVEGQCWVPGTRFRLRPGRPAANQPAAPGATPRGMLRRLIDRVLGPTAGR